MWQQLLHQVIEGNSKALARSISFVENEQEGYEQLLAALPSSHAAIIGVTGPPGAGKSTLVDALVGELIGAKKRVAVLCVDPSSPFHFGAVLGDRIRMSRWYIHPDVFIRSLATRGSIGGLHPKIIEISELVKAAGYDDVIIETVGVGQSEIEIAGLADITVVVLVPEGGDEVQTMKAGLMEIADLFVVNKSDRPGADAYVANLKQMLAPAFSKNEQTVPVIKTVASSQSGISELAQAINDYMANDIRIERRSWLMAERAYYLIRQARMNGVTQKHLQELISKELQDDFNLYRFVKEFLQQSHSS
jgi:LAO/AO transport system kinase